MTPPHDQAARQRLEEIAAVADRLQGPLQPGGPTAGAFVRVFLAALDRRDLQAHGATRLAATATAALAHASRRVPGTPSIRVEEGRPEADGPADHAVVEVVTDDVPFLVDSITMELSRQAIPIRLVVHPILRVARDADGLLQRFAALDAEAGPPHEGELDEALVHVEVDPLPDEDARSRVAGAVRRVLEDVRVAVEDYPAMRERLDEAARELAHGAHRVPREDVEEAVAFLRWLDDDHFTFLGARAYRLESADDPGRARIVAEPGTGLGILRGEGSRPARLAELPDEVRAAVDDPQPLVLTKADARATVHRPAYLDHVGVKRVDAAGRVVGEWRFLGLYTSRLYTGRVAEVPLLRRKVDAVVDRADLTPAGHAAKKLLAILEGLPREELLEVEVDELEQLALGLLGLQERREVRLFLRRDRFGRYVSCLLFVPRDRYDTQTRLRLQELLRGAFAARDVDHEVQLTESVLARVRFVLRVEPGARTDVDVRSLERRLAEATRTWEDDLRDALVAAHGQAQGHRLAERYARAFPAAYREDHDAEEAVDDVDRLEALGSDEDLALALQWRHGEEPLPRLKLYRPGPAIALSHLLPPLEHLGFDVVDRRPYRIRTAEGPAVWCYELRLACDLPEALDREGAGALFRDAFLQVWRGRAEDDALNRLVVWARLRWQDVAVLRAYARYLRQTDTRHSQTYMQDALVANPEVARRLVALFHTRFDPDVRDEEAAGQLADEITQRLEAIASLDEDRILRAFLSTVQATLRTDAFLPEATPDRLVLKLDPTRVPELPAPLPAYEVFVYSPRTEGIHLRGGKVARGGIRWSDRREDFRTEVLGLAKAQTAKNAVIVPVGAKGGFVLKTPPPDGDPGALRDEVRACYRIFVGGLLDVTDDLVDGEVVTPAGLVRYDDDDPYLVVAADKGTATFSDTANELSEQRGFWLGDAFASGGSSGYDHKAMGITARGAWESVRRHFRELGTDVQHDAITVVGIGDMSGDVFGNGLLRSRSLRLVGAFDHRHVFIDPDPDPEASYGERRRLYDLAGSSWDDYDRTLISEGGGVWSRSAKSVALAAPVRWLLGVEAERLTPDELIVALLRADVDLLYNGGVGTFVKAADESHDQVGDRANDRIRVDASDLRAAVVGEGGNLGFTQRARVQYSLSGGRINTDAIDNSGGVDCSDREVNIKILLAEVERTGGITRPQRDELLRGMTDEVGELVVAGNYEQALALSSSAANAVSMADVLRRYLSHLEQEGHLDRRLEALPDDEGLLERQAVGEGLTRPELAVLLAVTKIVLYDELLASELPDDEDAHDQLVDYFPTPLREAHRQAMSRHRLRREIVATRMANTVVNDAGITYVFRLAQETGAPTAEIVRAHLAARRIFGLDELKAQVRGLDDRVVSSAQTHLLLEARRLVERGARWLVRNVPRPLPLRDTVERFRGGVEQLSGLLPDELAGLDREAASRLRQRFEEEGVPARMAGRFGSLPALSDALDLVRLAEQTGEQLVEVAGVHAELAEQLHLDWLRDRIGSLPRDGRWDTLARDALREEFAGHHASGAAAVLSGTEAGPPAPERVSAWLGRHGPQVRRCEQVLREIRAGSGTDLAMLSVALRELRNLVHAVG